MRLRDYQQDCHDANVKLFASGSRSTLNVLSTGTGKTHIFSHLANHFQSAGKVLVLCHERELIAQAESKLRMATMDAVGIEQGERRVCQSGLFSPNVVVASIPTMVSGRGDFRRMHKFNPKDFALVVADECHFAVTKTWRSVIDYFTTGNPDCKLTGFTATPDRHDERSIMGLFPDLAFQYEYLDALNDGWLVKPRWGHVPIYDASTMAVRTGADFLEADVSDLMNEINRVAATVEKTIELCEGRKTLFFCVDINHAETVVHIYGKINNPKAGITAMVTGKTPIDARDSTIRAFRSGAIRTLAVVGIASHGFDVPDIGCIVLGRPSASRPRVSQNIGRGTRPLPGLVDGLADAEARREAIDRSPKPDVLIVDFCFNNANLVTPMEALLPAESPAVIEIAERRARASDEAVDVLQVAAEANKELAELSRLKRIGEGVRLDVDAVHEWIKVDPFAAIGQSPREIPAWTKGRKPTQKMIDALLRAGVPQANKMPFVHAQQILDELGKYPSEKQCKWIRWCGLDPRDLDRKQAGAIMGQIAEMRWKLPRGWKPRLPDAKPVKEATPF